MIASRTLKLLRAGEFARIATISRFPEPWLGELVGRLGYDLIWLDLEHRPFGYEVIAPLALACRANGIDLMVRILKTGYTSPMRVLEEGANGVMVPHCLNAAEARQWVKWTKFPPLGERGFDGAGADADHMLVDPIKYMQHANAETFLVLQIEDREALDHIEEIINVEGVDLLFVGIGDLSISLGVPMQMDHPLMQRAIDRVANAAQRAGKWWSLPAGTPEAAQRALDRGARLLTTANDHVLIVKGLQDAIKGYQGLRIRQTEDAGTKVGA
jgi:4-hydroxy-2-oxoheptanedioate aldolase